tara:strand:+ start:1195 stop:1362 length:168 start_codon:yes stop_codon:yes gene_type:complete
MCSILAVEGSLEPSDAFNCRNAEKFTVDYHFNGDYEKFKEVMIYELAKEFEGAKK